MKKLLFRIFIYCGVPILLVLSIGAFYWYVPKAIPIAVESQEYDTLLTPREFDDGYHLYFLYQYPKTKYIVAKFIKQKQTQSTLFQDSLIQTEKIVFIDMEKWKRTLAFDLEYSIRDDVSKKWFYSLNRLISSKMLRMNDGIIHQFHYSTGKGLAKSITGLSPWMTKLGRYTNHGESEIYTVGSSGELIDMHVLKSVTPVFGTSKFFTFTAIDQSIALFQTTESGVEQLNVWDSVYSLLNPIYLGNNTYFVQTHNELGPRILVDSKPSDTHLIPIQQFIPQIGGIYSLSAGRFDYPAILLFLQRGYGGHVVYEMDSRLEISESIFAPEKAVYRHLQKPPFTVMNQNQVLVFQNHDINLEHQVLKNSGKLYYSMRETNTDGSPGKFSMLLQDVNVPNEIEMISKYPFDDDHLLMYGNNAIWTMKWDGTELMRIFPSNKQSG